MTEEQLTPGTALVPAKPKRVRTKPVKKPYAKCGAKTRGGKKCPQKAGWGTNHVGIGKCRKHGGKSGTLTHGRYSKYLKSRIGKLFDAMEADPDPLNILPDLAVTRALFIDFINRYEITTEALLAWHADWQMRHRIPPEELLLALESVIDEQEEFIAQAEEMATDRQKANITDARKFVQFLRVPIEDRIKPRQVLDISDAWRIVSEATKIVERIEDVRAENAISRQELRRVIEEMGRVVLRHVPDDDARKGIRDGWLDIRLA